MDSNQDPKTDPDDEKPVSTEATPETSECYVAPSTTPLASGDCQADEPYQTAETAVYSSLCPSVEVQV